jgi:hypothetical protein
MIHEREGNLIGATEAEKQKSVAGSAVFKVNEGHEQFERESADGFWW